MPCAGACCIYALLCQDGGGRQHCRLIIWNNWLSWQLTNVIIRWQDPNNISDTGARCLVWGGAYLVDKQQELRHLEQRDLDRHKETCWHVHTKNKRQTYPKSSNTKIAHIFIQPVWESISRLSIVTGTQDVAALTRCKIELWKALFSDW